MKSNLTIKIGSSFNVSFIFDTKNFYGSICALSSSKSPMLQSVFFSNILYTNKDTIHHISHKWAFKWQQFIPTSSLNSYSAFTTLK